MSGTTPQEDLRAAVLEGDLEAARDALDRGARASHVETTTDGSGCRSERPLLFEACQRGDAGVVRLLLERGARAKHGYREATRSRRLRTPCLAAAARSGSLETVRLLLERGANPDAEEYVDEGGVRVTSALDAARLAGHREIEELLVDRLVEQAAARESAPPPGAVRLWALRLAVLLLPLGLIVWGLSDPNSPAMWWALGVVAAGCAVIVAATLAVEVAAERYLLSPWVLALLTYFAALLLAPLLYLQVEYGTTLWQTSSVDAAASRVWASATGPRIGVTFWVASPIALALAWAACLRNPSQAESEARSWGFLVALLAHSLVGVGLPLLVTHDADWVPCAMCGVPILACFLAPALAAVYALADWLAAVRLRRRSAGGGGGTVGLAA